MADDSLITQCPHCNTSFRVRKEQLAVANGSVRCGACLQVFSARNHIVSAEMAAQQQSAPQKAAPRKQAAASTPKPGKPVAPPAAKQKTAPADEFRFAEDEEDDAEFLFMDGEDGDDFIFSDSPGDSLFDEEEKEDGFGELSDSFLNLRNNASKKQDSDHFHRETLEMESNSLDDDETPDESWAESMLEEIEKEDKISISNPAIFEAREAGVKQSKHKTSVYQPKTSSVLDFDAPPEPVKPSMSQIVTNASKEMDLDFGETDRLLRLRPIGWFMVVLLCILLAGQLAWYKRDTYARMDQWRGLYQQVCNVLNCSLPEQVDLSAIRSSVLVREHKDPSLRDMRIVDIVLTNKAPFKQPFPKLLLQYTDVNDKPVADQLFTPEEYLKGELTGETLMPINTRIYISFPIKAQAQNAVNYQLSLFE